MHKNSKLKVYILNNGTTANAVDDILKLEASNFLILQIAEISACCLIIEYVENDTNFADKLPQQSPLKSEDDMQFENYLDTIILRDPFGKYSGKMIREIFENGDEKWLDTAFERMHNTFILDKLKFIVDRGGYGKIIRK